ncbi:OmpA family protein [Lutibacter oricola]|uniref:OmpA family protein n=1 Tax=Lutibacter oricola TaxID=762486 RepID=A0A1H2WEK4_9FLAO|nr:OmpA family protein [Lutibacter oricola]SDW79072.1 OmpA family protein [Lutibacter oricola]
MKKIALAVLLLTAIFTQAQEKEKEYKIFNTSINSKYAEVGVIYLSENNVLFASSKRDENDGAFKKNRRKNNKQLYLDLYNATISENGNLKQTKKFTNDINNKFFESDVCFTKDLKTVYFTWNNYYNTSKRKDSLNWKTLHIVKATINKNFQLSNIIDLPFNNEEYSVKSPMLNSDESKLYFVSDNPDNLGETDIYVVDILGNNKYSQPRNLGSKINTKEAELFPFIDSQNNLYFASTGHTNKNGFDIFKAERANNEFSNITKLPSPVNSKYDDFAFVINNQNNVGFFTSNRPEGKGDVDIYNFKIKEIEEEVIEEICLQSITGIILNKNNRQQLNNVQVFLYKDDKLIEGQTLEENKKFLFEVDCDATYKIKVQKDGFLPNEIKVTTSNVNNRKIGKKILLSPKNCIHKVKGLVVDINNNTPLNLASINIFKENILIDSIKVTNEAKFKLDLKCKANYKLVANQRDYLKDSVLINTNYNHGKIINKILSLKPNIEFVTVREQKMVKTNPIYFDLNKADIRTDAAIELNKVVDVLKKYPNIKIEVKSHTDSRAPDNYNLNLSNSRAQSTINYIAAQGIDLSRIYGKGYGETQLVNKCKNGAKCTEAQHQLNRRTEFVVIEE